jgi:hypothetical protein
MEMLVLRNGTLVWRIRIGRLFATDSEATVVDTNQGIRPMDKVRAIFTMPYFSVRR